MFDLFNSDTNLAFLLLLFLIALEFPNACHQRENTSNQTSVSTAGAGDRKQRMMLTTNSLLERDFLRVQLGIVQTA